LWTILDRTKGMKRRETMGERLFRMTFLRKIDTVKKNDRNYIKWGKKGWKNNMGSVEFLRYLQVIQYGHICFFLCCCNDSFLPIIV